MSHKKAKNKQRQNHYKGYNQNQHAEQHHDFDCVVDEKLNAAADFPGGI